MEKIKLIDSDLALSPRDEKEAVGQFTRGHTKSGLNTPFLVETRQKAKGKRQEKEKTSSKKGVIKADLVSDPKRHKIRGCRGRSCACPTYTEI
jgi:hypothetical protein